MSHDFTLDWLAALAEELPDVMDSPAECIAWARSLHDLRAYQVIACAERILSTDFIPGDFADGLTRVAATVQESFGGDPVAEYPVEYSAVVLSAIRSVAQRHRLDGQPRELIALVTGHVLPGPPKEHAA